RATDSPPGRVDGQRGNAPFRRLRTQGRKPGRGVRTRCLSFDKDAKMPAPPKEGRAFSSSVICIPRRPSRLREPEASGELRALWPLRNALIGASPSPWILSTNLGGRTASTRCPRAFGHPLGCLGIGPALLGSSPPSWSPLVNQLRRYPFVWRGIRLFARLQQASSGRNEAPRNGRRQGRLRWPHDQRSSQPGLLRRLGVRTTSRQAAPV